MGISLRLLMLDGISRRRMKFPGRPKPKQRKPRSNDERKLEKKFVDEDETKMNSTTTNKSKPARQQEINQTRSEEEQKRGEYESFSPLGSCQLIPTRNRSFPPSPYSESTIFLIPTSHLSNSCKLRFEIRHLQSSSLDVATGQG